MNATPWTPARVAKLEQGIADGLSGGQIAAQLRMTRNMVIGKAFRLGLSFKGQSQEKTNAKVKGAVIARRAPICIAAPAGPKPPRPPKSEADPFAKPKVMPKLRVVQTDARMLVLADLEGGMCKYPVDDPGPGRMHLARFCAADAGDELYCPAHMALCFTKPKSTGAEYTRSLRRYVA